MVKRFENKTVLITGSGTGIGKASAIRFAEEGANVVVNAVHAYREEVADEIRAMGGEAFFIEGDVSNEETAKMLVEKTVEHYGSLDVLVNNAGIVLPGRIDDMSTVDFDRMMAVNVRGLFLTSRYAVRKMLAAGGGTIVHVSSVAALKGIKNRCAYSASKGAVLSITRAMALDYLQDNIRVNCVSPGTTETEGVLERFEQIKDPELLKRDKEARYPPLGRLGKTQEIAEAILFAADDSAAFMTGQNITIDGGMTIV